ncbi:ParB N-terminal domain-containing protein [Candidatus Woesearchaeota archaeon]|nr:ParB N-terminal domain-containing protein [Candidatus Woesearchaeota archaeon]
MRLGVFDIETDRVLLPDRNERKTWRKSKLIDLIESMQASKINLTPAIVEITDLEHLCLDDLLYAYDGEPSDVIQLHEGRYQVIAGSRRRLVSGILGLPHYRAAIYTNVSDEDRVHMQVIENSTKRAIPAHEHAQSWWEMYVLMLSDQYDLEADEILSLANNSYHDVDAALKTRFSMTDFARHVGRSVDMIRNAFDYVNLHGQIKQQVEAGKIPYSVASALGHEPNRNRQRTIIAQARENGLSRKSVRDIMKTYVDDPGFTMVKQRVDYDEFSPLRPMLRDMKKLLGKLERLADFDITILGNLDSYGTPFFETIRNLYSAMTGLKADYNNDARFRKFCAASGNKGDLVDRISAGDVVLQSRMDYEHVDLVNVMYLPRIPIGDIVPCIEQPRKTFDGSNIASMSDSIEKYGIMQTIMVRPLEGKYEIVVGETRYRSALQAGLTHIEVLCCPMDDGTARRIQIAEDLFEVVNLAERAERLHGEYLIEKRSNPELSLEQFSERLGTVGISGIRSALRYADLDQWTKDLHTTGLISYASATMLHDVECISQRHLLALESVIFDISSKQLERKIRDKVHQSELFTSDGSDIMLGYELRKYITGLEKVLQDDRLHRVRTKEDFHLLCAIAKGVERLYRYTQSI